MVNSAMLSPTRLYHGAYAVWRLRPDDSAENAPDYVLASGQPDLAMKGTIQNATLDQAGNKSINGGEQTVPISDIFLFGVASF